MVAPAFGGRAAGACIAGWAALYRLARTMFGTPAALIAAAALAVSFWALMYARFKLRQVSELAPMLLAFYFFWRTLHSAFKYAWRLALWGALFLALSLYTY